jgi:DNA-binding GntR family transcriptional regulator
MDIAGANRVVGDAKLSFGHLPPPDAGVAASERSYMDSTIGRSRGQELDHLVRELRDRIHKGDFVPGQRLVEHDLVAETGMSRGRVRDALRVLESENLVEINRNKGACVRRISRKEVSDTIEVMRALSILMTDKAISRIAEPEVRSAIGAALEQARAFREQAPVFNQSRLFMDQNARFWDVFAELSQNPVLIDTRMRLETTLFRLALEGARITSAKDQWITRHEDILAAVLAADCETARQLVEESVRDVEQAMLALPDSAFSW